MPQLTPIKGFTNTPVTRSLCIVSIVATLAVLILSLKPYVVLAIDPYITQYAQYWRVATFQLAVVNESDFLLCTVLWFQYKTLERFFGPRKYLSLVAMLFLYNAAATFVLLSLGQLAVVAARAALLALWHALALPYFKTIFNAAAPGPLGVISLLYVCHAHYIPVTYSFKLLLRKPESENADDNPTLSNSNSHNNNSENADHSDLSSAGASRSGLIFNITLTSHFQVQILYTILLLNHGFSSVFPCLVGIVIGKLYTLDLLPGARRWIFSSLVFHLFVSPSTAQQALRMSISRCFRLYQPLSGDETSPSPFVVEQHSEEPEEDREMAIDDLRNQEDDAAARLATPVRPLGRRFLDTFRA